MGGVFLFFHAVDKAANQMLFNIFNRPNRPAPAPKAVLLQVFIPSWDEDLVSIFTSACQEAGGRSSPWGEGDREIFFAIPTGHLAGIDWYIGLLEASGLWWSLIEK